MTGTRAAIRQRYISVGENPRRFLVAEFIDCAGNRDTAALQKAFALFDIENFSDGRYRFNGAEISNDAAWKIILDRYKGGYTPTLY